VGRTLLSAALEVDFVRRLLGKLPSTPGRNAKSREGSGSGIHFPQLLPGAGLAGTNLLLLPASANHQKTLNATLNAPFIP
jgi:hypothetical protein